MHSNSVVEVSATPAMAVAAAARSTAEPAFAISPVRTTLCLVGADAAGLFFSVAIGIGCKLWFAGNVDLTAYFRLWPLLFLFFAVFTKLKLYSLVGLSAPEELRRSTMS